MTLDPQGYPVQQYLNLRGEVVFEVMSDGTLLFNNGSIIKSGNGSPNGIVEARQGSLYMQIDGTPPDMWWQKQTGTGNTGWVLSSGGGGTPPAGNDTDIQFNNGGAFGATDQLTWQGVDGLDVENTKTGYTTNIDPLDTGEVQLVGMQSGVGVTNLNPAALNLVDGIDATVSLGTGAALATINEAVVIRAQAVVRAQAALTNFTGVQISMGSIMDGSIDNCYGLHISGYNGIANIVDRAIFVEGGTSEFTGTLQVTTIVGSAASLGAINIATDDLTLGQAGGGAVHIIVKDADKSIRQTGLIYSMALAGLQIFANNAAAIGGGLVAGDLYRTGADPDVICVVH